MFEVFTSKLKGRGLRSTTVIPKGKVIISSDPFVCVLSKKNKGKYCDLCFKRRDKLLRCSRCKYMNYCDQSCQKSAWKEHKKECSCLKNVAPKIPPDFVILLTRILQKIENNCSLKNDGDLISVTQLESNYGRLTEEQKVGLSQFLLVVKSYWGRIPEQIGNPKELLELCARIKNNSFAISDEELQSDVGTGIYLSCSLLNHDCDPNCVVEFTGSKVRVHALREIPAWVELSIGYVDLFNPGPERRKELFGIYGFKCGCRSCSTGRNDAEMTQRFDGMTMQNLQINDVGDFLADLHEARNEDKLDVVFDLSSKYVRRKVFPNSNVYVAKILDFAMDSAIGLKKYELGFQFGAQSLPAYKEYLDPNHPMTGLQVLKLGKICFYLKQLDQAIPLLLEAKKILQVTHSDGGKVMSHVEDLIKKSYLEQNILASRK